MYTFFSLILPYQRRNDNGKEGKPVQPVQSKYGYGMTFSACLWLGVFPLLQGGTYSRITHDKWVIMLVLACFTFLCFLFDLVCRKKNAGDILPGKAKELVPLFLSAGLLLWTVLSCLCSSHESSVWWYGEGVRMEGLASQLCYFAVFTMFFLSRVNLKPVLLSAAASLAVFFVIVMLQRSGANPVGLYPAGRSYELNPEFQGTIGNIDMCTGYLVLLAGFFLHSLIGIVPAIGKPGRECPSGQDADKPGKPSLLTVSPVAAGIAGLLLSVILIVTMDVQFGVIALSVLFIVTLLRFLPRRARLPVLILLIVLILLVVWFWPGQEGGVWELHEILHGRARKSFGSNRIAVWYYSLLMAGERPVLGFGSGTFREVFNQYLSDHSLTIPKEQDGVPLPDFFDNPHNEYVAQLTDHGLPGLLLFLTLILIAVFRRREGCFPLPAPCSAAVLCYAVQAFFSFSVCIVAPMFWMLLGLSFRE